MPGPIDEFKQSILDTIDRQFDAMMGQLNNELGQQGAIPGNPYGAALHVTGGPQVGTGYDSGTGETTVVGIYGISIYGDGDIYWGS